MKLVATLTGTEWLAGGPEAQNIENRNQSFRT